MRRCISLIFLTALVGTIAGCDTSPTTARSTPWTRIVADDRFQCGIRSVDGDPAPDRPDGVRIAMDRTQFACRFGSSIDCVLWVSAINGKQEYWMIARGDEQVRLVDALADALDWSDPMVEAFRSSGYRGGRYGDAEWGTGLGGALVVNIADPAPVT